MPHTFGFGPIHLLIPVVFGGMLFLAFRHLVRGNISGHRRTAMQGLCVGACVVAGVIHTAAQPFAGRHAVGALGVI